jgi:hypothetical protein
LPYINDLKEKYIFKILPDVSPADSAHAFPSSPVAHTDRRMEFIGPPAGSPARS